MLTRAPPSAPPFTAGPKVRIRLPPAGSLQTLSSRADDDLGATAGRRRRERRAAKNHQAPAHHHAARQSVSLPHLSGLASRAGGPPLARCRITGLGDIF